MRMSPDSAFCKTSLDLTGVRAVDEAVAAIARTHRQAAHALDHRPWLEPGAVARQGVPDGRADRCSRQRSTGLAAAHRRACGLGEQRQHEAGRNRRRHAGPGWRQDHSRRQRSRHRGLHRQGHGTDRQPGTGTRQGGRSGRDQGAVANAAVRGDNRRARCRDRHSRSRDLHVTGRRWRTRTCASTQ